MSTKSELHTTVQNYAGDKPALVLSSEALKGFLLNNFKRAKDVLLNRNFETEGEKQISVRFSDFSVDPNMFNVILSNSQNEVYAELSPYFVAKVEVFSTNNPSDVFSEITYTVSDFRFTLNANAPYLNIASPKFSVVSNLTKHHNRENALIASGLDEFKVLSVEGAFSYVMPSRLLKSVFATISNINLEELFPGFELKGSWEIVAPNPNEAVLIIPSNGIEIRKSTACHSKDNVPDLSVKTNTAGGPTQYSEKFKWPIKHTLPSTAQSDKASKENPFAGIYLTKPVLDTRFTDVIPAVIVPVSGEGFISYSGRVFVTFRTIKVAVDTSNHGFFVALEFTAKGSVDLSVDVPCIGREHVATVGFNSPTNNVHLLLTLQHTSSGKLSLLPTVQQLNIGDIDVTISGFTHWVYLLGGQVMAVALIAKIICEPLLEDMLPTKMEDALRKQINHFNLELLNLGSLQLYTERNRFFNSTYSADDHSALIGITGKG